MKSVILDIDNCIADDGWRIRYIAWDLEGDERWGLYHARAGYDFAKNRNLVRDRHPHEHVIFLTGRPESCRPYTVRWLEKNYLPRGRSYDLFMREEGDAGTPAAELKRRMLFRIDPATEVVAAYDDREDIVEMYKDHGLNAFRLAIHAKDAYAPPEKVRAAMQLRH